MAYSFADIARFAYNAGFRGTALVTAVAVAMAESRGDQNATGVNHDGTVDRGLWQINSYWHKEVSPQCAYDPACAVNEVYRISEGGKNWNQWTTYTTGAYKHFEASARAAASAISSAFGSDTIEKAKSFVDSVRTFVSRATVSQWFGPSDLQGEPAYGGYAHFHKGVDLAISGGTDIPSFSGGTVIAAGWDNGFGNYVKVKMADGRTLLYGHLSSLAVSAGDAISSGQILGKVGSTGYSTGDHLHVELTLPDGKAVDPLPFINAVSGLALKMPSGLENFAGKVWDGVKWAVVPGLYGNAVDAIGNIQEELSFMTDPRGWLAKLLNTDPGTIGVTVGFTVVGVVFVLIGGYGLVSKAPVVGGVAKTAKKVVTKGIV